MKTLHDKRILWFEPDDRRKRLAATLHKNGSLRFSRSMQDAITSAIRIGFIREECALAVEKSSSGYNLRADGSVPMNTLSAAILEMELELPLRFLFVADKHRWGWIGHVVQTNRKYQSKIQKKTAFSENDTKLLKAYDWLIDRCVQQYAKTTPIDERRANAREALVEAMAYYTPAHGELRDYLFRRIKTCLIERNRLYTGISPYNSHSLDAPIDADSDSRTRYETISGGFDISSLDDKIDIEVFAGTRLTSKQRTVFNLLLNGYLEGYICEQCSISRRELSALCVQISDEWSTYQQ